LGCFGCEGEMMIELLMKLGGWARLWIVLSLAWVVAVTLASDWKPPESTTVKSWPYHQPSIEDVNDARAMLCESKDFAILYGFKGNTDKLYMPTMAMAPDPRCRDRMCRVDLNCVARDGHSKKIASKLPPIFVPPLVLLALGFAFGWVRKGFQKA
jgi:hypothetical protein